MTTDKRLDVSGGINIGHRQDRIPQFLLHHFPSLFKLIDGSHIRHRTTGSSVREDHDLLLLGQDICRFSHEMNATEHDIAGSALPFSNSGQLQGVPSEIGEAKHLVPLIMMPHHHQISAQCILGLLNPLIHFPIGQVAVTFWKNR